MKTFKITYKIENLEDSSLNEDIEKTGLTEEEAKTMHYDLKNGDFGEIMITDLKMEEED
jgi:hypothetical protein